MRVACTRWQTKSKEMPPLILVIISEGFLSWKEIWKLLISVKRYLLVGKHHLLSKKLICLASKHLKLSLRDRKLIQKEVDLMVLVDNQLQLSHEALRFSILFQFICMKNKCSFPFPIISILSTKQHSVLGPTIKHDLETGYQAQL